MDINAIERRRNEDEMNRLDPHSHVPLYHQLFERLRDGIADGTFAPLDLLPSEADLEKTFNVSRITVRRALDELRLRNFVVREKGRGTRVSSRKPVSSSITGSVEGMLENNLVMGLKTHVEVLEFDYVPVTTDIAEALNLEAGEIVQHSVRVRQHEGVPFSFLTTFIPAPIGRLFSRDDMTAAPLLVLLEKNGVEIDHAEQSISAESASSHVARCLEVEPGHSLLRIDRTAYDVDNRPVQHIIALYRPEIYSYRMKLARKSKNKAKQWMSLS